MKGFDAKFIEELKNKNDLVEVVSKYVHLEQRGGNYWGRCPFHHEKTASFTVNAVGQFYYCFGCHKSGDVISFIMGLESLDFNDAVKLLAERAHMTLPEVTYDDEKVKEQKKHKERVFELLKDTARFYVSNLRQPQASAHREYILKRGLSNETVVKFGIGASLDYNGLVDYLKAKGYTEKEMIDSGAVGVNKNGKCYDFLAGRLIIPGIDQFGNVISFCGRIIDNRKDVGKYVNTRETLVFTKGKNLFNINNLKKLKNEKGLSSIIMVEGHMDVISLVQAGFENVVASMGTALTKDQARILKRYAEKILICYDGDFAGQKATVKGLEILKEEGLDVKVVALPDGLDPDDVIRKYGKDGYQGYLDDAKPLIDFKLDIIKRTFDVKTVDGKRKYISSAIKVIRESDSPAEQEDLLKIVRDYTGTTYESLRRELYSADTGAKENTTVTTDYIEGAGDKVVRAARFVLYSYLFKKPFADVEDVNGVEFTNPVHIEIMHYVREKLESKQSPRFSDLFDMFENSDHAELSLIAEMETDESKNFDQQSYYNDCIRTLKIDGCNRKLEKMTALFSQETDLTKRREYAKVMARLLAEKNGYVK